MPLRQSSRPLASESSLPRWRTARDLMTALYCMMCRRSYISSTRMYAKRKHMVRVLKDLGALTSEEMYEAIQVMGKGAGLRDAFANPQVSQRVNGVAEPSHAQHALCLGH